MLAELYNRKGAPLPPALTGIHTPAWNPVTSSFRFELGSDKGLIKLGGLDVDLFNLWKILFASGLSAKVGKCNEYNVHFVMSNSFPGHT